jgi:hypothetical protein
MQPAGPPEVYRARRGPVWACWLTGGFLLLLAGVMAAALPGALAGDAAGSGLAAVLIAVVVLAVPGAFIVRMGINLARIRIAVSDQGLELTANRFRIWTFRRIGSARLAWTDVRGIQAYDTPNFAAPGGTQVDYVLHTTRGLFTVPNVQFPDAARIAARLAARIGRPVGDLPPDVTPVGAARREDRRGIRLMRALGWTAQVSGALVMALFAVAWFGGGSLEASEVGGIFAAGFVLLIAGGSLRRFSLK